MPIRNFRKIVYFILIALIIGIILYLSPQFSKISSESIPLTAAEPLQQIGKPFKLKDHNNHFRTKEEFQGKILLIYFGYTFCPDICPTTLYHLTDALNILGPRSQYIQSLFITIDPERDNQQHLKEFLSHFHPSILGLTGTVDEINQVINDYKVYAHKMKPVGSAIDYLIDHTSIVYVYNQQGNFVTSFNDKTSAKDIVAILTPYL